MDRNGEDWTGDDVARKANAPGGARDDAAGEHPANADEGVEPQKDIDQQAGKDQSPDEHMSPYPNSDFGDEADREKDPEEALEDDDKRGPDGANVDDVHQGAGVAEEDKRF